MDTVTEQDPFAPPTGPVTPPVRPPVPPPQWGPPPAGGPPPPPWAHPQLQQPWQDNPWAQGAPGAAGPSEGNGLAVAALVTGCVALVPVSLGLGVAALIRARRTRSTSGLGLVAGALGACLGWTTLLVLFFVVGFSGGFDPRSQGRLAALESSEVGTCLNADLGTELECSTPHDLEVYFSPVLPHPVWPGTGDLGYVADELCNDAFKGYVGTSYDDSELGYEFYAPTEDEWAAGKHQVVCVITSADELRGSVKGSRR